MKLMIIKESKEIEVKRDNVENAIISIATALESSPVVISEEIIHTDIIQTLRRLKFKGKILKEVK